MKEVRHISGHVAFDGLIHCSGLKPVFPRR